MCMSLYKQEKVFKSYQMIYHNYHLVNRGRRSLLVFIYHCNWTVDVVRFFFLILQKNSVRKTFRMKQNVTPTQQCSSQLLTRNRDLNQMVCVTGLNAACNINKDILIWFGK